MSVTLNSFSVCGDVYNFSLEVMYDEHRHKVYRTDVCVRNYYKEGNIVMTFAPNVDNYNSLTITECHKVVDMIAKYVNEFIINNNLEMHLKGV